MKLRDRLRYWFDRTMDRGTPALIGWLGLCSALMILVVTVLVVLLTNTDTEENGGWAGVAWMSLLRTLDPGTMGADKGSALFLSLMLFVTIGGIFVVSALIGVLTTGLEKQIDKLRKGRSRLIERGHTIVLGWSDQVFTVISELVKANQGERSCVVVLAGQDKVDMEQQIRARIPEAGRTRVICRSGNPLNRADLELVSPDTAKAIIVLPRAGADADIDIMKTLLLLNNRTWRPRRPHVVTAVQNSENLAAARLAGGESALVIDADDIAVRLVVQSHRQAGLSTVCTDLLDFAGNELYLRTEPSLIGRTFGEAVHAYELGVPIGLRTADGQTLVNPDGKTLIEAGDQVIVLAEDDLLIRPTAKQPPIREEAVVEACGRTARPDRTLLIGWNARGAKIIDLLDRLVEPGSVVVIAAPRRPDEAMNAARAGLSVHHKPCRPTSRASLERLDLGSYQHIVVLADDDVEPCHADDRTLVTLLHLRDIEERLGDPFSIVTEMNDDQNREVAQVTKADDFIVSSRLISLLLTQLSENRHLHGVFAALFDPSGSEIYLKPAPSYVPAGARVNFATVLESARRRGESAIGYRLHDHSQEAPTYGVRLNPPKDTDLVLEAHDSVIVLAES
ncbi:potassium transporter TrkA [Nonomuraea sp. NPDC050404]|uniref:CASTOR/POLLUX-related putative ion channel n=1 Tax=Nonomuraea sp. NPDC050404 TaxID=3155783 RepID=UPI0033D5F7F9